MIKSIFINLLTEVAEQEINKELQSIIISLQLGLLTACDKFRVAGHFDMVAS